MNDLLENLDKLVLENKLSKANLEIKKYLSKDSTLTQELFEKIQKVFELINQKDISLIRKLIELSLINRLNLRPYILKVLKQINESDFYYIYPFAKEYFISNGMLEDFENCFLRFKKNILKNKAYTCFLKEVEELQGIGIDIDVKTEELSLAYYGQGNIEYFEKEYENALRRNKRTILSNVMVDFEDPIWRKQSFIMKETVLRNKGSLLVEDKKEFLKSIYELLLVNNEVESCLLLLLEYSCEMRHKVLAEVVSKALMNKYNGNAEELRTITAGIKHEERGQFEDIDLADDLFGDEVEKQDMTIRRLVNQINILKDERDLEGATKLLQKLKVLDSDHTLVKELEEKEHKIKGSKLSRVKRTLSEIEQDLINELSVYCEAESSAVKEEESFLKIYTKKTVDLMPIDELLQQYRELIYSYNTLGFYESSLRVIERVIKEGQLELKEEVEALYLNIEILRMSQNYYGALNIVEKSIEEKAMTDNEKVSFYYLKGEILREIGRRSDALKAYSKVSSINKRYRMVAYRLKEIE